MAAGLAEDKDIFYACRVLELRKESEDSYVSSSVVKKNPNVQPFLTANASHTVAYQWPKCEALDTPVPITLEALL